MGDETEISGLVQNSELDLVESDSMQSRGKRERETIQCGHLPLIFQELTNNGLPRPRAFFAKNNKM